MNMRVVAMLAVMISPIFVYAAVANVPYCSISSGTTVVNPGTRVRLVWYTVNATRATIAGVGQVALGQGYYDVAPTQNTTYTMTVSNDSGSRTCAALITMARPQPVTYYTPPVQTYSPINMVNTTLPVTRNFTDPNYKYTETTYYDTYGNPTTSSGSSYYDDSSSSYYETNTQNYYYPSDNIAENYYLRDSYQYSSPVAPSYNTSEIYGPNYYGYINHDTGYTYSEDW